MKKALMVAAAILAASTFAAAWGNKSVAQSTLQNRAAILEAQIKAASK